MQGLPAADVDPSTNLELAPVVAVLTEEQKDLLLLRALQKDPTLAEHLLEMASEPITAESAAARPPPRLRWRAAPGCVSCAFP